MKQSDLLRVLCVCAVIFPHLLTVRAGDGEDFLRALRRGDIPRAEEVFLQHQNEAAKSLEQALAADSAVPALGYRQMVQPLLGRLKNAALREIVALDPNRLAAIVRHKENARSAWRKGNLEEARRLYRQALRAAESASSRWQQQHISFLIAYTLADQGRFGESDAWLQKSWNLRHPRGVTHLDAMVQENLGNNAQKQGDLYPALQHYHQALELHALIEYAEGIAAAANNLATLYQESGNQTAALDYYRRCLAFLPPGSQYAPTVQNNIADCLLELRRFEEAAALLEYPAPRGSAAYFQRLSLRHLYLYSTLRHKEASVLASDALRQALANGGNEFISDALRDAVRASRFAAEAEELVSRLMRRLPEDDPNRWEIYKLLAQAYYREGNLKRVEGSAREAFAHLRRRKLGADFEFNFSARVLDVARLWVSALARQGKTASALVVWEKAKGFAQGKQVAPLHAFQQTLGPECAALDFCVADSHTIVWVIRRRSVECVILDTSESTLSCSILALLARFASPSNLLAPLYNRQASQRLYRLLMEPLQDSLRGARCWTIFADRRLHALPFEMLEDTAGRPLLERTVIRYWDLLDVAEELPKTLDSLTAWVDGPFDDSPLLPAGRTRTVRTWEDVRGSRGDALHYAGHSLLDRTFPAQSLLSPQHAVTARQIAQVRLPYRLIVLSSCNSAGLPSAYGDSLLGLSRAFQRAGARQVIATLWPIDERSSFLLREFYRLPLREAELAQNLQRARLEFRRHRYRIGAYSVSMSSPYFWAPYILMAPHYPHSAGPDSDLELTLIPLAALTTRYCIRRRRRPHQ